MGERSKVRNDHNEKRRLQEECKMHIASLILFDRSDRMYRENGG